MNDGVWVKKEGSEDKMNNRFLEMCEKEEERNRSLHRILRFIVSQFCNSGDGTGSRIESKLQTIDLSSWKTEQYRVAVVAF